MTLRADSGPQGKPLLGDGIPCPVCGFNGIVTDPKRLCESCRLDLIRTVTEAAQDTIASAHNKVVELEQLIRVLTEVVL